MQIDVFMSDKRSTHRLERRGDLAKLIQRPVDQLDGLSSVDCLTRRLPDAEFEPGRLMFLKRQAIDEVSVVLGTADE